MKKKLLAFLFVAIVAVLTFAVSASAATSTGKLGDNCTYSYDDETGVLTISGTGVLAKTSTIAKNTATKVVIEEGITEIPTAFFFPGSGKTSNLVEVTLPSTLTAIPKQAFYNCDKLTTVNIPENNSIVSVGDKAFSGAMALKSIAFSDNLQTVGAEAFLKCYYLKTADLGGNLTSLGNAAFNGCLRLTEVNAGGTYTTIGGHTFYGCSALTTVTISDAVTSIGDGAFRLTNSLTSFEFPSALKTIGVKTFRESAITGAVVLPSSVTSIGEQAFFGCKNITSMNLPDTVTTIGQYCFINTAITSINIPAGVTAIPAKAFSNCKSLTTVVMNDTLVSLGAYAFSESAIESIVLPSTLTTMDNGVFWGCTGLKSVQINADLKAIPAKTFQNCTALETANIPESVLSIQPYSFYNCSSLKSVEIPSGLLLLYNDAFYNTKALTVDVVIPGTVKSIGDKCFYKSGITGVTFNEGLETIGATAFRESGITGTITIPTTCTIIGGSAFRQAKITEANVPASVTSIGDYYVFFGNPSKVLLKTEATAEYIITWAADAKNVTLDTTYVPGGGECTHEAEVVKGYDATCTVDGLSDGSKCALCGETIVEQEVIPATGHKEETVAGYAATCTVPGLTDGTKCAICGDVIVEQEVIPAPGHTFGDYEVTTTDTPWNDGVKTAKCNACEDGIITETFAFEGNAVGLDVTINGTTATATLDLFNVPALTSLGFKINYTAEDLTLTEAKVAELEGYTTDPAIANPVKFVWIDGLKNVEIQGTVVTFTFTIAEGATIEAADFQITYDADDVCALDDANALVNVELQTFVRVTVAE